MNKYKVEKQIEGKTVIWFGEMTTNQPNKETWHTVKVDGTFNNPVVVMGPVSSNIEDPVNVRVKNVKRNSAG